MIDTDALAKPTTDRLLSKLLADPNKLVTEPVIGTNETINAQIGFVLLKVVEMVRKLMYFTLCVHKYESSTGVVEKWTKPNKVMFNIFGALAKDTYRDICNYLGIWLTCIEEQISACQG